MSINITADSSLQAFNTMAVPAVAKYLTSVANLGELQAAVEHASQRRLPLLVLGAGSNILLTQDFPGLVILNRLTGMEVIEDTPGSVIIKVASGENWHDLVSYTLSQNWFGLENLALIPGSVGAAPIQNIGAYGAELKDNLVSLQYLDTRSKTLVELNKQACCFGYRDSIFKHSLAAGTVITSVTLKLSKTEHTNLSYKALADRLAEFPQPTAKQVFEAVCAIRSSKLPLPAEIPNVGSFFKNPVVGRRQYQQLKTHYPSLVSFPAGKQYKLAAAWLIEQAGWKDKIIDQVGVHREHALVIINPQGAPGAAVLNYAKAIQADIKSRFGLMLEIEPQLI